MTESYKKQIKIIVDRTCNLICDFDYGRIDEMQFYKDWTMIGNVIIETRDDQDARFDED